MKTENYLLMKQAREALKGKWGLAVGTFFVYMIISAAANNIPKAGPMIILLIAGPLSLGLHIFSLALSRNQMAKLEQIFVGFKNFSLAFSAYLLTLLFTILWSLLLLIPGVVASLRYAMTFFIIADNPNIGAREAINMSKKMMMGNKWKLFCMDLRFLGWALLCIPTLGIGFLWLIPYIQVSTAKFYDDVKGGGHLTA